MELFILKAVEMAHFFPFFPILSKFTKPFPTHHSHIIYLAYLYPESFQKKRVAVASKIKAQTIKPWTTNSNRKMGWRSKLKTKYSFLLFQGSLCHVHSECKRWLRWKRKQLSLDQGKGHLVGGFREERIV